VSTTKPTLRQRRRDQTETELHAIAAAQLRSEGAAALSLRAIARAAGMAPSAVYRYFPSRDDLVTELLVRAFDSHADAIEAAAARHPDAPVAALRESFAAYRAWALANPAEFGLAYTAPVPGYEAPPERTLGPGLRVGQHLLGLLQRCHDKGLVDPAVVRARQTSLSRANLAQLTAARPALGIGAIPVPLLALGLDAMTRLHGFVSLEVFGQLRLTVPDGQAYFGEMLEAELRRCGLDPSRARPSSRTNRGR
jgi:AcrR family transcriptional regulator